MLLWAFFLATIAGTSCQELLQKAGVQLSASNLVVEEITQIMNENDPSGRNHSLRVRLSEHAPLPDVTHWVFIQHKNGEGFTSYKTVSNGDNQTVIIFEGNLINLDSFIVRAMNQSQDLAMAYQVVDIEDFQSRVSWVGEPRQYDQSSLRVDPGRVLEKMTVNGKVCNYSKSPCYYILPDVKPSLIRRCINVTGSVIPLLLCDERVSSFTELEEALPIKLQEDETMYVDFVYEEYFKAEVVVYDPENSSVIYSEYPYQCRLPIGGRWKKGDNVTCRHSLTLPEGKEKMMVLIVVTDDLGTVKNSRLQYFDKNAYKKLSIEKISAIERDSDPTQQNIKVTFTHQSLPNIGQWKLTLQSNNRDPVTYTVDADGTNPSTQTEAVFVGSMIDSNAVVLQAWDTDGKLYTLDFLSLDIPGVKPHVTWVGGKKSSTSASLRVVADDIFPEIDVGEEKCTQNDIPCYYITPDPKPVLSERCKDVRVSSVRVIKLCDDTMSELPKIDPEPTVTLTDDEKLEVEFDLSDDDNFLIEVQAYDHADHTKVLSTSGYECKSMVKEGSQESTKMTCYHRLTLPEDQGDFMVLIVKSDSGNFATASSLIHHAVAPQEPEKSIGVTVGIIVGVIAGIAVIAFIIFYVMKNRKTEPIRTSNSYKYTATKQEEPKENTPEKDPEEAKEPDQ